MGSLERGTTTKGRHRDNRGRSPQSTAYASATLPTLVLFQQNCIRIWPHPSLHLVCAGPGAAVAELAAKSPRRPQSRHLLLGLLWKFAGNVENPCSGAQLANVSYPPPQTPSKVRQADRAHVNHIQDPGDAWRAPLELYRFRLSLSICSLQIRSF